MGRARTQNEDAFFFDDQLGIYLVCDGMGGHAAGQIASQLAIATIVESFKTGNPPPPPGEDPLVTAMQQANKAVLTRSMNDAECRGMGTTVVGLRVEDDLMHVCHCGDSRIYLLRNGGLIQITRDHSLINLYEDKPELVGKLGKAESNIIVRAIGLNEQVEIDHRLVAMEHGDLYLLCSDGVVDLVEDWMIREILTSGETMENMGDSLIRSANGNGGTDNITAVLVSVYDSRMTGSQPG